MNYYEKYLTIGLAWAMFKLAIRKEQINGTLRTSFLPDYLAAVCGVIAFSVTMLLWPFSMVSTAFSAGENEK